MDSSEWITANEACIVAHWSRPIIFRGIRENWFESFLLKTRPDSQSGLRLIRRSSLLKFMEKQFKEQQVKPPIVRRPLNKSEKLLEAAK